MVEDRPSPALLLPSLLVLVAGGTVLVGALTPRDLSLGEAAADTSASGDLLAFALSRLLTAAAVLIALGAATFAVVRRGLPRAGLGVWIAFSAFASSNFLLPAVAGAVPGLDGRLLYPPLVFMAVYFAEPLPRGRLATACKWVLGAFIYGALLAALVVPDRALAEDYEGLLPGVAFRLYGVAGGATSLGAQAAAYLGLEVVAPSRSWTRWVHRAAALTALLLTQSKTAWAFALLVALAWGWRGLERRVFGPAPVGVSGFWRALLRIAAIVAGLALVLAALALLVSAGSAAATSLQTLTGRTYIWATTTSLWLEHPVFGYGLELWESDAFKAQHGNFAHAHNQLLHSLGSAGLVGLAGLLAYLGIAWRTARRAAAAGDRVPLLLLALTLAQCVTEVPLRHAYLLDPHTVLDLLLFAALIGAARAEPSPTTPDPAEAGPAAPA
ncbi:MAG: O-antigen ligase family protein [Anaeromyxobacteraceae bacterium]|nr:O-antigen ligase family protein [Anaeromyxobacteraceae bacterium]